VNVIWTGTAIAGPAVSVKNGDLDQDTEVGPGDFEAVVAQFGNSGDADCDNDGEVGPSDFEIVVGNFGLGDE
jgi:putative transposon-encoded protein